MPRPDRQTSSEAWERFVRSMQIDYGKWRDGEPYDLDAIRAMTAEERTRLVELLRGRTDWRDVDALALVAQLDAAGEDTGAAGATPARPATRTGRAAERAVRNAARHAPPEARFDALARLHDAGKIDDAELESAVLDGLNVAAPFEGMSRIFDLLDRVPTDRVRRRLLWCALNRPKEGALFAAKLWQLCGKSDTEFDWSHRDLFLHFGPDRNGPETLRARQEFFRQVKMTPEDAV